MGRRGEVPTPPESAWVDMPPPNRTGNHSKYTLWLDRLAVLRSRRGQWLDVTEAWGIKNRQLAHIKRVHDADDIQQTSRKIDGTLHVYMRAMPEN